MNHKQADAIIAVSEFTKSDIVEQYGIDPNRIEVIYNAAPAGFRSITQHEKELVR